MIVNLRGTNGSGKTTVARALLKKSNAAIHAYRAGSKTKPEAYLGSLLGTPLYVLGSYESVCGGMDTVTDIRDAVAIVNKYGDKRGVNVFYEGLFISHSIGSVGEAVKKYGDKHVIAFLDTPLDECIRRVIQRRTDRGDLREFNPKNVTKDWQSVFNCRRRCDEHGLRMTVINHKKAEAQVLTILTGKGG